MSSSFPSPLLPALPFILLTPNLHVITPTLLQNSTPPPTIQMTKHFYKPHIEDIKHRFEEVMALGNAVGEEWFKGLDRVGKERMSDSARCERWEAKGGLKGLLMPVLQSAAVAHHDIGKHGGAVHASASSSASTGEGQPIVEFRSPSVHKGTRKSKRYSFRFLESSDSSTNSPYIYSFDPSRTSGHSCKQWTWESSAGIPKAFAGRAHHSGGQRT
jgi:hypothetical protein